MCRKSILTLFSASKLLAIFLVTAASLFSQNEARAAIAVAQGAAAATTNTTTTQTTTLFTPVANTLYLMWTIQTVNSTPTTVPTVTCANGLTMVQVNTVAFDTTGTPVSRLTLFRAMKPSGLSNNNCTITWNQSTNGNGYSIVSFTGADTSGTDGSGAVAQSVTGAANNAGNTGLSIALAALQAGSTTAGGFSNSINTTTTLSPGTGYTPGTGVQYSTPNTSLRAEWDTTGITTVNMTQSAPSNIGGIAVEVKPPPPPTTVVSINCSVSCAATSAATVSWTVTFSSSVTGVDASAFALAPSGLSGAFITAVTGSGTTWTITANTGIGSGTLGLNQTGPGSVSPTLTGTFTGQVYTISATPALAEYRMDEAIWNGTAGEVADTSGTYPGQAFNSANTTDGSRAIAGDPGTCRYGLFDNGTSITQGYVALPGSFPNLTTDFSITAWIRTTNNAVAGQRILIDDQNNTGGYGLSLSDGTAGILRFYSRGITPVILDSTYTIANNTWYFVAAVADITNRQRTIYVFNAAGALLNSTSDAAAFTGTWGTDAGPVSIGGETNTSAEPPATFHFKGNLDEVRVYQKVLSQSAVAALATQTHACAGAVATPGVFNAFETSTAAGAITGVIRTKVAGTAFGLDVVAITSGAQQVSFSGNVKVELLANTGTPGIGYGADNCPTANSVVQTLASAAISGGRSTVNFSVVADVFQDVRVRISFPTTSPTVTSCSTDSFAIRPNAFANFGVSDTDWQTAGTVRALNDSTFGTLTHKAGRPFSVRANAVNAAGTPAITTNYTGSPAASLSACGGAACTASFGTLSLNTAFSAGQLVSDVAV
jgi:MSHA biogenesis protein MshQ